MNKKLDKRTESNIKKLEIYLSKKIKNNINKKDMLKIKL